jgi:uncharacterized membrane protein
MSSIVTFIGHWHPVLVHLPIGMILAALLLQLLAGRAAFATDAAGRSIVLKAVSAVLLAGVISAAASCFTGWVLSSSGEYDPTLVGWHMWMGISLTFLGFFLWVRVRINGFAFADRVLSLIILGLVIVTGHLGGSLTHGSDYLFLGGSAGPAEVDSPIVNVQEAHAYAEIIRPILRDNCYGCHGARRQKGGLRMDDPTWLAKGGKDGVVILPGRGNASELIKRLLLPEGDEHHMPPKEKKQLNSREILLLRWWIDQGADPSRRVAELKQPDSVRPALLSVQGARARPRVNAADGEVPAAEVAAADEKDLAALRAKGVLVMEVARGSHWLEVEIAGGVGGTHRIDSVVRLLLAVKKQLVSLKAGYTGLGDSALRMIGQLDSLRSLDLAGNSIGDAGLAALKGLAALRVLNLVGTAVSAAGIEGLKGLPKLRRVYLYQTKVGSRDWAELKRVLPKVEMDTGGYSMPVLAGDTSVVKQGKK